MKVDICDRCEIPVVVSPRHWVLNEYVRGDSKGAWSVRIYLNRIDARGPIAADLCTACATELLREMATVVDGPRVGPVPGPDQS